MQTDPLVIAPEIFKAYDIRGIVGKTLTGPIVEAIGHAIGSEGVARGVTEIVVGRDGRLSGPELVAALARGIRAAGVNVVDIGQVATPLVYYATHELGTGSGVMVTGSHNPPDYNGLKMVLGGEALYGDTILALRERIVAGNLTHGAGTQRSHDVRAAYFERVVGGIKLARPMKIAIDCGNGVAGAFAPELFRRLGCEVTELFCEVDGTFPNHHPDPAVPKNLADLIACVKAGDAELGFAFDGDGDRLGVVTKDGHIIYPDRQLMLYAADVLSRNPGATIIYDVKCTRNLKPWITQHGGKPLMWKTGHSLIKAKMAETGSPLAGEMSGHIFFADKWYGFDDAPYSAVRLLGIVARMATTLGEVRAALPQVINTPELRFDCADTRKFAVVAEVKARLAAEGAKVQDVDGVRVLTEDGWWLLRASNTQAVLVARAEASSEAGLERLKAGIARQLQASGLAAPDFSGANAGH